jgi:asparagine synthase (glutamine-hydrolysing)
MPSIFKKGLYLFAGKAPFAFKSISSYVNIAGIENDTVRFFTWFSSLSQKKICGILNREFVDTLRLPADLDKTSKLLGYKGFEANEYLDFKYWLPDNLLERADRLTMANSLEMRAPFLDHDFVEFCFSLPGKEKIKGFLTKVILRRAMKKRLPKPVLERTKVGFSTPFKYWIRNELREWAADMLFSGKLKKSGVFNQAALRGIFEEHVSGAADNSKIIWTMVNFEIWYNRYFTERDRA